jgi:ABC-type antimicrobial peptide transport system permease subunit
LEAAVSSLGSSIRAVSRTSLEARLERADAPLRWLGRVFALAGALALLLAAHGLYVVMRYRVDRRRREIGIRAALGAEPSRIVRMVLGEALRTTGRGLLLGLWLTTFAAGLVKLVAPRVSIMEPTIFLTVSAALATAALLGGWSSARRAAALEPGIVLTAR